MGKGNLRDETLASDREQADRDEEQEEWRTDALEDEDHQRFSAELLVGIGFFGDAGMAWRLLVHWYLL
jgi:hypothetical protein